MLDRNRKIIVILLVSIAVLYFFSLLQIPSADKINLDWDQDMINAVVRENWIIWWWGFIIFTLSLCAAKMAYSNIKYWSVLVVVVMALALLIPQFPSGLKIFFMNISSINDFSMRIDTLSKYPLVVTSIIAYSILTPLMSTIAVILMIYEKTKNRTSNNALKGTANDAVP